MYPYKTEQSNGIQAAADLIAQADGLIITAGAGIGIDSGLPDFRGKNGFWKAYPALGELGLNFMDIANPQAFKKYPEVAWGFYGHRLQLYRDTIPHEGFYRLMQLAEKMAQGARVFTSNVDGQFQKAGFSAGHVTECHGSIHYLQCMDLCGQATWAADVVLPVVDTSTCRLLSPLPCCPACGGLARPNILMFDDWDFKGDLLEYYESTMKTWIASLRHPIVIEIGAGTAIPSARRFGSARRCPLIRINPNEFKVGNQRDIGIALGAKEALVRITDLLIQC
jgi:NAD-dependent SIR2 family protein deacetylase